MRLWKDGLQVFLTTALNATELSVSFLGRLTPREKREEHGSDQETVWILRGRQNFVPDEDLTLFHRTFRCILGLPNKKRGSDSR